MVDVGFHSFGENSFSGTWCETWNIRNSPAGFYVSWRSAPCGYLHPNSLTGCEWDNSRRQLALFIEERASIVGRQRVVLLLGRCWAGGVGGLRPNQDYEQKAASPNRGHRFSSFQSSSSFVRFPEFITRSFSCVSPLLPPSFLYLVQMCSSLQTAKSSNGPNRTRLPCLRGFFWSDYLTQIAQFIQRSAPRNRYWAEIPATGWRVKDERIYGNHAVAFPLLFILIAGPNSPPGKME